MVATARDSVHVILKGVMSLDGYIDDVSPQRLVLSSPEDLDRLDQLRAECDAILVGGNTLRQDNPRLLIRSQARIRARLQQGLPPHPCKMTLTRSGQLPTDARFFRDGQGKKFIFCNPERASTLRQRFGSLATIQVLDPALPDLAGLIPALTQLGIRRLLVEGGTTLATSLLETDLVDELQVTVAPFLLGQEQAPRLVASGRFIDGPKHPLTLARIRPVGHLVELTYLRNASDTERWLVQAIQLADRCPPSERAFAVGAVLVNAADELLATGYSRERDPSEHAEEAALAKVQSSGQNCHAATLYSSLEPCGQRLSGKPSCVKRILDAGIRRVVFAWREPPIFVPGTGAEQLCGRGIEVEELSHLAPLACEANRDLLERYGRLG